MKLFNTLVLQEEILSLVGLGNFYYTIADTKDLDYNKLFIIRRR